MDYYLIDVWCSFLGSAPGAYVSLSTSIRMAESAYLRACRFGGTGGDDAGDRAFVGAPAAAIPLYALLPSPGPSLIPYLVSQAPGHFQVLLALVPLPHFMTRRGSIGCICARARRTRLLLLPSLSPWLSRHACVPCLFAVHW